MQPGRVRVGEMGAPGALPHSTARARARARISCVCARAPALTCAESCVRVCVPCVCVCVCARARARCQPFKSTATASRQRARRRGPDSELSHGVTGAAPGRGSEAQSHSELAGPPPAGWLRVAAAGPGFLEVLVSPGLGPGPP